MRPKPLIPTRTAMRAPPSSTPKERPTPAGTAKASGSPARDDLYPQAVGIAQIRGVVALAVLGTHAGRAVAGPARTQPRRVRRVDGRLAARAQRDVAVARPG